MGLVAPNLYIQCQVDFTAEYYDRKPKCDAHKFDERLRYELGRLSNHEETCVDHQCWVNFNLTAKTWRGIQAQATCKREAVLRILQRLQDQYC